MFGFLNASKPVGPTSHDIVAMLRRRVGKSVRVGHAGTLDPFASGVLVLCAGQATRLAEFVQRQPKRYRAAIRLGAVSSTDDPQGDVVVAENAMAPSASDVRAALEGLVGQVQQVPPAHSAVHVDGRRAYKLARAGQHVELAAKTVTIYEIALLDYDWPTLRIDVRCGSGTYIRSLARDIGAHLGVGGYCQELVRTAVGPFELAHAKPVEQLDLDADLVDPMAAMADVPQVRLDEQQLIDVCHGKLIALNEPGRYAVGEQVALVSPAGKLTAIAKVLSQNQAGPEKVFASA